MSNTAALQRGAVKARQIIRNHLTEQLKVIMRMLIMQAVGERREDDVNNTGNTINAYVATLFVDGKLQFTIDSSGMIHSPRRSKLNPGEAVESGTIRWSGTEQRYTKQYPISTSGGTEPSDAIRFAESYQPKIKNGWEILVCNGVEYATYQENQMKIDVLTNNYDYAKRMELDFQPMPD